MPTSVSVYQFLPKTARGGDGFLRRRERRLVRWFRWGDAVPAALVLIAALVCFASWLTAADGARVRVQTVGETTTFSLADNASYVVESGGYRLTLVIKDGRAFVTDATCPDKVCEHTGAISRTSESIACVPASVIVTVEGTADASAPDGVTR